MPKACKSNDKHCKSNEQDKRTHDMKQTDIARLGQENAIEMIGKEIYFSAGHNIRHKFGNSADFLFCIVKGGNDRNADYKMSGFLC